MTPASPKSSKIEEHAVPLALVGAAIVFGVIGALTEAMALIQLASTAIGAAAMGFTRRPKE